VHLTFHGHDYRYAVEQSLLAFFPQERPVYGGGEDANTAVVSLEAGSAACTAVTELSVEGSRARGVCTVGLPEAADPCETERLRQRAVKMSFFRAAQALTGRTPAWGALTGIRPAKLAAELLEKEGEAGAEQILRDFYQVSPPRRRLALACAKTDLAVKRDRSPRDVSLYAGIPFCPTRCAYCSFVSNSVERSFRLVEPYLDALCDEIRSAGALVRETGLRVRSFYMGGGTPTALSAAQLDRLLDTLEQHFDLSGCERTVEAGRPDTITAEKLDVLLRHGVARISVNPQSMSDAVLAAIGRRHSAEDIRRAVRLAAEAAVPHVNMDLIAGLPEDTPEGFQRSLDEVVSFGVDSVTVHTLALKKGSRIMLEGAPLPGEAAVADMLSRAQDTLTAAGYAPYYLYRQKYMSGSFENVGWAKSGGECLYNIYIMEELHTILSMGAGGSTKLVDPAANHIERVFNLKYPQEYIARPEKIAANHAAFRQFYARRR